MLIDARSLPARHLLHANVCIVGAGAAGLTIAQELARYRHQLRVVVLEGGGRTPEHATQRLYDGVLSGRPYYPLDDCRFRMLGGTTAQWGGWCRPLDAIDFEARDWLPESGWPLDARQMARLYERAQVVCRLGPCDYDAHAWAPQRTAGLISREQEDFEDTVFQVQPTRFGDVYGSVLQRSSAVDVLLNANVLEIKTDSTGRTASEVRAATLRGNHLTVQADVFVLAAGGIENARILLCSRSVGNRGIGNEQDLVGRYFSDHLHIPIGILKPRSGAGEFYALQDRGGVGIRGAISLTEQCRRRMRGLGFAVTLHNADDPHDVFSLAQTRASYRSLQALVHAVRQGRRPERLLHHVRNIIVRLPEACTLAYRRYVKRPARTLLIGCRAEQAPNPDSRVMLDDRRDVFGMPKVRLEWRLSEQDLDSVRRAQSLLSASLRHERIEMFPFRGINGSGWGSAVSGGAHHMGTTRMHRDPRYGVVNEDCRVHGTTNLYVAGSSVFPTGGWAPPTLTVVALALRLADHLATTGRETHA